MKDKTWNRWIGKRVRRKAPDGKPIGPVGVVQDSMRTGDWWKVQWPDGKTTQESTARLVIVDDEDNPC